MSPYRYTIRAPLVDTLHAALSTSNPLRAVKITLALHDKCLTQKQLAATLACTQPNLVPVLTEMQKGELLIRYKL